jgi:hypothetical protein
MLHASFSIKKPAITFTKSLSSESMLFYIITSSFTLSAPSGDILFFIISPSFTLR